MAARMEPERTPDDNRSRTLMMYTTLMLILVSIFASLLSRSNFDETKYASARTSVRTSFGDLTGGRVAVGEDEGLPDQSLGFDQSGRLVLPEKEMAQVRALLAPALRDREARIIRTQNRRVISLSAGLVFNLDSSEISQSMAETLTAFAKIIADGPVTVAVEGHTDNQPPQTEGAGDNWDVSSRRALAVLDFLIEPGGLDPKRLTAFGYAGTRPLHSNLTPEGRARNNRVDLVLDFSKARARDLENMAERARSFNYQGFDFLLRDASGAER